MFDWLCASSRRRCSFCWDMRRSCRERSGITKALPRRGCKTLFAFRHSLFAIRLSPFALRFSPELKPQLEWRSSLQREQLPGTAFWRTANSGTNKKGDRLAAFLNPEARDLQNLYVLRLPALGPFDYVERDSLALLQAAEAIRLDCRIVNKYVFPILTADKAVALRVIEPLNRSLFHGDT